MDCELDIKLQEAEADFDAALEAAGIGYWHWDVSTDTLRWDARMHSIYGTRPDIFTNTYAAFDELLVPEDRERVSCAVHKSIDTGEPFRHTFRLRNGRLVLSYGTARYNTEGVMTRLVGVNILVEEKARNVAMPFLCSQFCPLASNSTKL